MSNKNKILENLLRLQKVRGDTSGFKNHDDFLPWSDNVQAALFFDKDLEAKFFYQSSMVKQQVDSGVCYRNALGECVGILNQAIIKLELGEESSPSSEPIQPTLEHPETISVKWLVTHVPVSFWVWCFALISASFSTGVWFSETALYQDWLKPKVQQPVEK
ncbi:hypothetical protein QO230_21225 [Vibrio vulnificus]|uniref:hypothetical protein n=1 Tax=Vibrio vulnificus TaxID=672 RepID=UPI0024E04064|nr:hypothetical protein [Vibrio vulnificus]MDK2608495.1 hypothetical protein [Vibrio vulnificus]MDK2613778.1 hypothetical protein [Vibrio vulnificus]MDK2631387.1 hypothetical protein [Vibrio vulnificus]MDK2706789.1 hypothetical protein [Vibrio vulnificus]